MPASVAVTAAPTPSHWTANQWGIGPKHREQQKKLAIPRPAEVGSQRVRSTTTLAVTDPSANAPTRDKG